VLTPLLDVSILHNPTTQNARKPFRNEDSNGRDAPSREAPFSVIGRLCLDVFRKQALIDGESHDYSGSPV